MPWDVVDLRRLRCGDPASDALSAAFRAAAPACGWTVVREREDVCPVVTLPEGDRLRGLSSTRSSKKARHEIRRKIRRAEAAGEVALTESTRPARRPARLHRPPPGAAGASAGCSRRTPGGDASRVFIRRLFEAFGPDGPVRLSFLTVGGRRIAAGHPLRRRPDAELLQRRHRSGRPRPLAGRDHGRPLRGRRRSRPAGGGSTSCAATSRTSTSGARWTSRSSGSSSPDDRRPRPTGDVGGRR